MEQSSIVVFAALFLVAVLVVFYVLYGISHMKALKYLGCWDKAWMAWLPPLFSYYALADAALDGEGSMQLSDSFSIPALAFKLWYLIALAVSFIPSVGFILNLVITIICLGTCYTKIYARLEQRDERDVKAIGYVSGLLPIIAVCKFLAGKYNA